MSVISPAEETMVRERPAAAVGRVDVEIDDAGLDAQHVGSGLADDRILAAGLELLARTPPRRAWPRSLRIFSRFSVLSLIELPVRLGFHDGSNATSTGSSLTRL